MHKKYTSIDQYHADCSGVERSKLEELRSFINAKLPEAQEGISHNIPSFKMKDVVCYYSVNSGYICFYPTKNSIAALRGELKEFITGEGVVHLPIDRPLPIQLIQKLINVRLNEMMPAAS